MSRLMAELHRCVHRYQTALLAKTLLLAALGVGVLAAIGWRLYRTHGGSSWLETVLLVVAVAGAAGLGWWLRRRWLSRAAAVRALDDAMGLEQRLITAQEFEKAAQPPALYPLLLSDTMSRLSTFHRHVPHLFDRTTVAMAIILLLLLVWPVGDRAPIQLAHRTDSAQPPQPSPEDFPPPEPQQQDEQQQDPRTGQSQQDRQHQEGQGPSSPSGQGGEPQRSPEASASRQRASSGRQEGSQGESSEGQSGDTAIVEGRPSSARDGQADGDAADDEPDGQIDQRQASQKGEEPSGRRRRSRAEGRQSQHQQQADLRQASRTGGRDARQRGAEAGPGHGQDQQRQVASSFDGTQDAALSEVERASSDTSTRSRGGGSGRSAGSQEALRAEIQELLKNLQGELHQIQERLAAKTSDRPYPNAGIGSDPNLYGAANDTERATGPVLPIQLKTDDAPTSSPRQGSGVGQPSGEIATASPQMPSESADLSDQPVEEPSSRRRALPPEYQPVFEKLYQRTAEPGEQISSP